MLTDEIIAEVTADEPIDERFIPAHLELGARVRTASREDLDAGNYVFTVHPAWSFGTLTSRFGPAVTRSAPSAHHRASSVMRPVTTIGALHRSTVDD